MSCEFKGLVAFFTCLGSVSGSDIPVDERVKLYCLDNPLAPDMDLRTVRYILWKGPGDLVITYSVIKPERLPL